MISSFVLLLENNYFCGRVININSFITASRPLRHWLLVSRVFRAYKKTVIASAHALVIVIVIVILILIVVVVAL
jgi:hypothetical protein